jgi:hypothetical protein
MNVRARGVSQKRLGSVVFLCACEIGDAAIYQIQLGIVHQMPGLIDREQQRKAFELLVKSSALTKLEASSSENTKAGSPPAIN